MEKVVITELTQGREFANELKNQLHPNNTTPRNACKFLLEKILSKYDNALALLTLIENEETSHDAVCNSKRKGPHFDSKSPVHNHVAKKRKPKMGEEVCCRTGVDQLGDDGYNWRKYGQKPILGANNPRSYYRCTHCRTKGCLAKKQVQRTDEDSSMFNIIYHGKHTCMQENKDMLRNSDMMISNEPCLEVENQELGSNDDNVTPFSFPSIPMLSISANFGGISYYPPFSSSATSESYFQLNAPNFQDAPEFDLAEIMSNPTPISR